jgi:acyl-CoA thioesterase-1
MKNNRLQKKVSWPYVLCLTFSLLLTGCINREIKNLDSQGSRIICLGDSITFGYGVSPGQDYPTALSKMMSMPVVNLGIDGDTSAEALKRVDSDLLGRDPLLVIVEFGGNDFLRKVPAEEAADNIAKIVRKAQEKGAMAAIVDVSAGLLMSEYRGAYAKVAKENQAIFVPSVLSGIITNPGLKSDFLHPNSRGYQIVAQRVYRAILPYLNRNNFLRRSGR